MRFAEGQDRAKSIAVEDNLWRASETVRAMNDFSYTPQTTGVLYDKARATTSSDALRKADWIEERARLEKMLEPGQPAAKYRSLLEKDGYQVTAVNDRESDEIEYEVVKAGQTFEVSLAGDSVQKRVADIRVSPNLWHAEGTEKALKKQP
ncbi:MAG: hypothetical protein R3E83_15485 [Burkholderiaceae bacterium]